MRVVTLSDHAAEQIQKAQDDRATVNDRRRAQWQAAADRRQASIASHAMAMREAWAGWRVIAGVVAFCNWLSAWLSRQPAPPVLLAPGDEEGRYQGGQEGEARVVDSLCRLFDDRWVAFKGYFNRGGETDLLLVGPTAIVALEVKFLNGVVHCEGDRWTRDKRDKYGNVVERDLPVRDARGRTPGQQVNVTADGLHAQLARRGHRVAVRRGVILAHHASRIGRVIEPGVEFIGVLADVEFPSQFMALVQPPPGQPDLDVAAIAQLVEQDHAYHLRARAQRGTMAPGARPVPEGLSASATLIRASNASMPTAAMPDARAQSRPRPIGRLPPIAAARGSASDLEQRQARDLGEDIIALQLSACGDAALDRKLRQTISGHLQNGSQYRVLSLASSGIGDDGARALLQRLIEECRQTVELEDSTLHAIVVPVAVRWQAPEDVDWSYVCIDSVERAALDLPSFFIQRILGVQKVVFSNRLYEGRRLAWLDARLLRHALIQLGGGGEPDMPELEPLALSPSQSADWQIVHLLAVAVAEPGQPLSLNEEARRALAGRHEMVANAVCDAAFEATGTDGGVQAMAEDVWALAEGIRHGRRLQRRHEVEAILAPGSTQGSDTGAALHCWYAEDRPNRCIRLLVDWGALRAEREFKVRAEEQPLRTFREALDEAVMARAPAGTALHLEELNLRDYRIQAKAIGMSWIGQGHGPRP